MKHTYFRISNYTRVAMRSEELLFHDIYVYLHVFILYRSLCIYENCEFAAIENLVLMGNSIFATFLQAPISGVAHLF